jgi:membrane fusion protein (multidrug efflux system)
MSTTTESEVAPRAVEKTALRPAPAPTPAPEPVAESVPETAPASPPASSPAKPPSFFQRHKRPILIVAGVIAAIALAFYLHDAYTHEETDDAYVTGHLHDVSSRINAVVTDVLVNDNQLVHKGDVLVKLDPSEYVALVEAAKGNLEKAEDDYKRDAPLVAMHAVSPEQLDAARSTRTTDLAQLALAQLQVQYSTITAPADGYIGRKNVEIGNRVTSGQTLMVVVEPDVWIVANFKETQLAHMRAGQPVRITVDSIPGKVFMGRVQSFAPATGNEFALLPADNSTGNFTKIVQRVPVKIVFDADSIKDAKDRLRIRAGESVVVKVALTAPNARYR